MRSIRVYPNPYHAIDWRCEPQCVVPYPSTIDRWVGARQDFAASLASSKQHALDCGVAWTEESDRPDIFAYDADEKGLLPVTVVLSPELLPFIARAINDGALVAADKDTASQMGIRDGFKDPIAQLEREKLEACIYILATKGVKPEEITKQGCSHPLAPAWAKQGIEYFAKKSPVVEAVADTVDAAPAPALAMALHPHHHDDANSVGKDDV